MVTFYELRAEFSTRDISFAGGLQALMDRAINGSLLDII